MVQFRGIDILRNDVIKELKNFDQQYPNANDFQNWLDEDNYKYVLVFDGKSYPPKYILSRISKKDLAEFAGGKETNSVFERLGFNIVKKKDDLVRYWKIAPGDNARFWDRCKKDKNIAVGWDEFLGNHDLGTFIGRKDEFEKYYVEKYKDRQRAQLKSQMAQLWNFINLQEGNVIVANRGMKSIVGMGRVIGPYKHRSEYSEYRHTIQVDWYKTEETRIPENAKNIVKDWWSLTLKELTEDEYMKLMEIKASPTSISLKHLIYSLLESKKQIILYGPPGTGKTHNTKTLAMSMLSKDLE